MNESITKELTKRSFKSRRFFCWSIKRKNMEYFLKWTIFIDHDNPGQYSKLDFDRTLGIYYTK